LVAEDREKEATGGGKRALLDRLDPASIDADRDLVLRLARDRAGVTPNTFSEIDGKPVVGHPGLGIYHARAAPTGYHHRATEPQRATNTSVTRPTGKAGRQWIDGSGWQTQTYNPSL